MLQIFKSEVSQPCHFYVMFMSLDSKYKYIFSVTMESEKKKGLFLHFP